MNILRWITKYALIILIGIWLAFLVARLEYDAKDLSASVLSITEQDFFEATTWDAGYKKENQTFEIFLAEQIRNDWPLSVSIMFSPSDFELNLDEITSNCSVEVVNTAPWNVILNVDWYEKLDFSEWIFQIPYSWEAEDITLEYIKSDKHEFAIWSLDNIEPTDWSH